MTETDRNRIAALIRSWRAFESTHAKTAEEVQLLTQIACEAIAERHSRSQLLANSAIQALRDKVTPIAETLGFDAQNDREFLFWATSVCLYLTAA